MPVLRSLHTSIAVRISKFAAAAFALVAVSASLASAQTVISASNTSGSFKINITAESGLTSNPAAAAAFQRAAQSWANYMANPVSNSITINIDANLTSSGFPASNIIGETDASIGYESYTNMRNAIAAQSNPASSHYEAGDSITASLPTTLRANLPTGFSLSSSMQATTANLKALGFTVNNTYDGVINFNSAFSFDYDSSNGVSGGDMDFQTAATHEIGHVLGFNSAADDVDEDISQSRGGTIYANPLDLFRFASSALPTNPLQFANDPRELRPGQAASLSDTLNVWAMSTGYYNGDGNQASHWKDDGQTGAYIGIMDPTLSGGTTESITAATLRAFDLVGYNVNMSGFNTGVAPEPGSGSILGFGVTALAGFWGSIRLRRRGAVSV